MEAFQPSIHQLKKNMTKQITLILFIAVLAACKDLQTDTPCFEILPNQPSFEALTQGTFDIWAGNLVEDIGDVNAFQDAHHLYLHIVNEQ